LPKPKQPPITAGDYGERIRRALWHRQAQTGKAETLAEVGATIAELTGRETPFTAGTVSGWLESRSEPTLAIFLALGYWTGTSASWMAFNEGVMLSGHQPPVQTMPLGRKVKVEAPKRRAK
jgi:hypothetical protein